MDRVKFRFQTKNGIWNPNWGKPEAFYVLAPPVGHILQFVDQTAVRNPDNFKPEASQLFEMKSRLVQISDIHCRLTIKPRQKMENCFQKATCRKLTAKKLKALSCQPQSYQDSAWNMKVNFIITVITYSNGYVP